MKRKNRFGMWRVALAVSVLCAACGPDVGQRRVETSLFVAGSDVSGPVPAGPSGEAEIARADVAFGPLYLCAGAQAGDFCETARLEWLDTVVIDALDESASDAGSLAGVSGTVRSWMYDLSISSRLTQSEPFVLDAAAELGGVSLVLEGTARLGGVEAPFSARVPVQQGEEGEPGLPVIRKSRSETFEHDVDASEPGLLVRFDPAPWVAGVDFAEYFEDRACEPDGPPVVCAGQVESTCNADGSTAESRDCGDADLVCVRGIGCVSEITIEEGSVAYRSIRHAIVSGERPTFEWGFTPAGDR